MGAKKSGSELVRSDRGRNNPGSCWFLCVEPWRCREEEEGLRTEEETGADNTTCGETQC